MTIRSQFLTIALAALTLAGTAAADITVEQLERLTSVRIYNCEGELIENLSEYSAEAGVFESDLLGSIAGTARAHQSSTLLLPPDNLSLFGQVATRILRDESAGCESIYLDTDVEMHFTPSVPSVLVLENPVLYHDDLSWAHFALSDRTTDTSLVLQTDGALADVIALEAGHEYALQVVCYCYASGEGAIDLASIIEFAVTVSPEGAVPIQTSSLSAVKDLFR